MTKKRLRAHIKKDTDPMRTSLKIRVDGIDLAANFSTRDGTSESLPGIVLAHGFAGARYREMAARLANLGFGVLEFDFRGYGESQGQRGHVIPSEQVADIRGVLDWLESHPRIDATRMGVIGSSLGGSIAIMAAAADLRIKACVAGCPLAHGDSAFRVQYDTEEKYQKFLARVEEKRRDNDTLPRFDLVFIPESLRGFLPAGTPMEFYADTVDGFLSLNPLDVIPAIAPRPIYIVHAEDDRVVPVRDARDLAKRAGTNCKLDLIESGDHFIFGMPKVIDMIGAWLTNQFFDSGPSS